jgi:hypothetical protein
LSFAKHQTRSAQQQAKGKSLASFWQGISLISRLGFRLSFRQYFPCSRLQQNFYALAILLAILTTGSL